MVSVILPSYNHDRFLDQRISSILNQAYQDFELIILDDCSTDSSKAILEKYLGHPKISTIHFNTKNSGSTFIQWNNGVALAKGKYIWIAESDDVADLSFLEKLVPVLDADPEIGIAYVQSNRIDQNSKILGDWLDHTASLDPNLWQHDFLVHGRELVENYMVYQNVIPNASAVLFRKEAYKPIPADFKLNGDWYLYCNILSKTRVYYCSAKLNYFREHPLKGSSRNILLYNNIKEYYMLLHYLFQNFTLNAKIKEQVLSHVASIWKGQVKLDSRLHGLVHLYKVLKEARKVDQKVWLRLPGIFH